MTSRLTAPPSPWAWAPRFSSFYPACCGCGPRQAIMPQSGPGRHDYSSVGQWECPVGLTRLGSQSWAWVVRSQPSGKVVLTCSRLTSRTRKWMVLPLVGALNHLLTVTRRDRQTGEAATEQAANLWSTTTVLHGCLHCLASPWRLLMSLPDPDARSSPGTSLHTIQGSTS